MAQIEGVKKVQAKLRSLNRQAKKDDDASVIVGYTQNYAIYVHENVDPRVRHPVGQAKFLEQPARTMAKELARIVTTAYRRGATLVQSLLLAGLRLQRESQKLVPVDTGVLKNSAFTRKE